MGDPLLGFCRSQRALPVQKPWLRLSCSISSSVPLQEPEPLLALPQSLCCSRAVPCVFPKLPVPGAGVRPVPGCVGVSPWHRVGFVLSDPTSSAFPSQLGPDPTE